MRQHFIDSKMKRHQENQKAAGITFAILHRLSSLWLEPINSKTGRNHNASSKTEHSVKNGSIHGFKHKKQKKL
jgi:hypothetical protein